MFTHKNATKHRYQGEVAQQMELSLVGELIAYVLAIQGIQGKTVVKLAESALELVICTFLLIIKWMEFGEGILVPMELIMINVGATAEHLEHTVDSVNLKWNALMIVNMVIQCISIIPVSALVIKVILAILAIQLICL